MLIIVTVKNVYARFSYATRRDGQVFDPYVQLMPITNVDDAHSDWQTWYNKWGGDSSHSSPTPTPTPTMTPTMTPDSHHSSSSPPPPDATDGSGKVNGAVEDDASGAASKTVRSFPFPPLTPTL